MPKKQEPLRLKILHTIEDELNAVAQRSEHLTPEWSERVTKYFNRAEALINLLEAHDCGSRGGYDKGQRVMKVVGGNFVFTGPHDIFDRWDWLYRKYHNPEKQTKEHREKYNKIKAFFKAKDPTFNK